MFKYCKSIGSKVLPQYYHYSLYPKFAYQYTQPLISGQYKVTSMLSVPKHIEKPSYIEKQDGKYAIYHESPVKHEGQDIINLKKSCKITAQAAEYVEQIFKVGMTADELDKKIHDFIVYDLEAYPTRLLKTLRNCIKEFYSFRLKSVPEKSCCHGIPDMRPTQPGDYINFDFSTYKYGKHGDSSIMIYTEITAPKVIDLIHDTQNILYQAIKICKPGVPFSLIGDIIEQLANEKGYKVCEYFTGHGIGDYLHMSPIVEHTPFKGNLSKFIMEPGNAFTIEPIIFLHEPQLPLMQWNNNFTVVAPFTPSAQWEHTLLITDTGVEVLTQRKNEKIF